MENSHQSNASKLQLNTFFSRKSSENKLNSHADFYKLYKSNEHWISRTTLFVSFGHEFSVDWFSKESLKYMFKNTVKSASNPLGNLRKSSAVNRPKCSKMIGKDRMTFH